MDGGYPAADNTLLKRALALHGSKEMVPSEVDPDDYTAFIKSLKPNPETTDTSNILCFDVPASFRTSMLLVIRTKLKSRKAPGLYLLRTEIFHIHAGLFADAALELWRAVGCTASVPTILRSGLLFPVYKNKAVESLPTNNRPVCLTTAFRRLISTALTQQVTRHYTSSLPNQWSF